MKKIITLLLTLLITSFAFIQVTYASETMHTVNLKIHIESDNEIPVSFQIEHGGTYQMSEDMAPSGYYFRFWTVDGVITAFSENHIFTITADVELKAYYVLEQPTTPIEPGDYVTIAALPTTTGNIYSTSGTMGRTKVIRSNNQITLYITYQNIDYLLEPFNVASNTDMKIFDFDNAFYYTDGTDKYVVFSHDPLKSMFKNPDGFIAYTILNLATFETKTYDKVVTRMHTVSAGPAMWTYFYVDQFVMDNLLSISLSFNYRYVYPLTVKGKWISYAKRYDSEIMTNIAMPWYVKAAAYTNVLTAIFVKPHIDKFESIKFNEILPLNVADVDGTLLAKINAGYRESDANFDQIRDDLKLFRIFLGNFQHNLSTGVQIYHNPANLEDPKNLQVIEFTYMTDGKINTIKSKDIDVRHSGAPGTITDGTDDKDFWQQLMDFLNEAWKYLVILASIYFAFKLDVFKSTRNTIIYIGLVVAFILYFGIL